ncbi:MAG: cysteine desulfurase [Verrucomicrobia bacterium]|nr:cysteine desulfurase [Verrucomicrobiota bacterium]
MIYFDHNASSPLHPAARAAWLDACDKFVANPASQHRLGQRAEMALEETRGSLANFLRCDPLDIVWTSGASEASNMVFHHFSRTAQVSGDEIWISAIEHPAVKQPAEFYFGKTVRFIPVNERGVISLDWLVEQLKTKKPRLVAVMAANNETGVLQPWRQISVLCREHGVPFCCDATQWLGKLPASGLGECDFVIGSAHKFGGPRGVGFLKHSAGQNASALIRGGKQQNSRRAGTENLPGILATVAALAAIENALAKDEHLARQQWRDDFETRLLASVPGARVIGANQERLWNTSMVVLPDTNCAFRWVVKLDKQGFAVSTGSACASGAELPSHVLSAMGCPAQEISNTIRISAGWDTFATDWERLLGCIISTAPVKDGRQMAR